MDDIKFMTDNVEPVVASEIAIEAIEKYYGSSHALELKRSWTRWPSRIPGAELLEEDEELDIKLEHVSEEAPVVRSSASS
jgi:hypothetical protein